MVDVGKTMKWIKSFLTKDVLNFGSGMILGVFSYVTYSTSKLSYYAFICPVALMTFILINSKSARKMIKDIYGFTY